MLFPVICARLGSILNIILVNILLIALIFCIIGCSHFCTKVQADF